MQLLKNYLQTYKLKLNNKTITLPKLKEVNIKVKDIEPIKNIVQEQK